MPFRRQDRGQGRFVEDRGYGRGRGPRGQRVLGRERADAAAVEGFVGQGGGRGGGGGRVLRSPGEEMLRGLTDGLCECDARGNGGEGAAGGHCGLVFEDAW